MGQHLMDYREPMTPAPSKASNAGKLAYAKTYVRFLLFSDATPAPARRHQPREGARDLSRAYPNSALARNVYSCALCHNVIF